MAGSTISSTLTAGVTLGSGGYGSPLSITAKGAIQNVATYGVLISNSSNGVLANSGSISAGIEGVYLYDSGASIVNHGFIQGGKAAIKAEDFAAGQAALFNYGTLTGGIGITGQDAGVLNAGFISGSNYGIKLQASTITNAAAGVITGGGGVYSGQGGTLINKGTITGNSVGVTLSGGTAANSGDIVGTLSTGARVDDAVGLGTVTAGSLGNTGSISGGIYGVFVHAGNFGNQGSVSGRIGLGEYVGGSASNAGYIYGSAYGAELIGRTSMRGGASLSNSGSIAGGNVGVSIGINGVVTNSAAGYIYGRNFGAAVYNGYLDNAGSILNANIGVTLASGTGAVENGGTIFALTAGIAMSGGYVTNDGTIYGATFGVVLSGGSLTNAGTITGLQYGVQNNAGSVTNYGLIDSVDYGAEVARGVVTNFGTIAGGLDAVTGQFVTLVVEPGAKFVGDVVNTSGKSLLELAGPGFGSLSGIGTQITGFTEISFASGPHWVIEGNSAGLGAGKTIVGFAPGDTIVLDGFDATSDSFVKGVGLELSNGNSTVTLDITGNLATGDFQVIGTPTKTVIANVTCFAKGTHIATEGGETAVERLRIGDRVRTLAGPPRAVKWIGRRSYDGRFIAGNKAVLPVCIKAGALADGVPARDLTVTPGHAISIGGVLVHAIRLVNGVSVVQAEAVAEIAYYHVELETHEILLAENCPAESFMGEAFRPQFQNAGEFAALYPRARAPAVMCQERLDSGFALEAILRAVRARAGLREPTEIGALRGYVDGTRPILFGWAQDLAAPEAPVCLDVLYRGGRIGRVLANLYRADVAQAGHGSGYHGFEFRLPAGIAGAIEVRRSADGARLDLADGAARAAAPRAA